MGINIAVLPRMSISPPPVLKLKFLNGIRFRFPLNLYRNLQAANHYQYAL